MTLNSVERIAAIASGEMKCTENEESPQGKDKVIQETEFNATRVIVDVVQARPRTSSRVRYSTVSSYDRSAKSIVPVRRMVATQICKVSPRGKYRLLPFTAILSVIIRCCGTVANIIIADHLPTQTD